MIKFETKHKAKKRLRRKTINISGKKQEDDCKKELRRKKSDYGEKKMPGVN